MFAVIFEAWCVNICDDVIVWHRVFASHVSVVETLFARGYARYRCQCSVRFAVFTYVCGNRCLRLLRTRIAVVRMANVASSTACCDVVTMHTHTRT